jgi:phosphatidylglycerophosphate synthase
MPKPGGGTEQDERAVVARVTTGAGNEGFAAVLDRLRSAQKSGKGAPPYSLYVNRPIGRILAATAFQLGLTPNQVTLISAGFTGTGLVILSLAPATWLVGLLVALLLVLGYALDAADGQLARLRGGGSLQGEWLDHTIDSVKVAALHLAVLISLYRNFELPPVWLLVPIGFAVVSSVHFFGMILVDLLARLRRASLGLPPPPLAPADRLKTLLKLPTDYGVFCLIFLLLGWHIAFFAAYTFFAVATAGYTVLVLGKWRRDVLAIEALGRS